MPTYSVSLHGTVLGQEFVASRYYTQSLVGVAPDDVLLENIGVVVGAPYIAGMGGECYLTHLHVRNVLEGSFGFDFIPDGWPVEGTATGAVLTSFVAGRINYFGATLGLPYRGYTRVSGLVEEDMNNQIVTAGGLTKLTNIAEGWTTVVLDEDDNSWLPALHSVSTGATQPIGRYTIYQYFTSQNSRKVGRGS